MSRFQYLAQTADGAPQSGSIDAADSQTARGQLERQGLQVWKLWPEVDPAIAGAEPATGALGGISAGEALELTSQIAQLAKAGLPLAAGLRALEAELPRGRFSTAVRALAARLEAGAPADAVFASAASRLPAPMRGMLAAGIRSGRLAEVLQECLEHEQLQAETRRRIWAAMAYPIVVMSLFVVWIVYVLCMLTPQMASIFNEFEIELPRMTISLLWLAGPAVKVVLTICAAAVLLPIVLRSFASTYTGSWLMAHLPLLGPLWRAGNLAAFCRLLAAMLDQSIPLPAALRLTAEGLQDGELKAACCESADRTAVGLSLSDCLISLRAFPQTLSPIVQWGEKLSALSEALRSAADLFRNRVQFRADLLGAVIPPMMFLFVVFATSYVLIALFLPLVKLISSLT